MKSLVLCMRVGTCRFGKIRDYEWSIDGILESSTWLSSLEMDTKLSTL